MSESGQGTLRRIGLLVVAGLALIESGCLLIAAGACAGGAAVGYAYMKGRIYHDYPACLADTRAAVLAALQDLQFPVVQEKPDADGDYVQTRTADGKKVRIHLDPVDSPIPADGRGTRVSIRVGAFGNEAVSVRLLNQVAMHLVPPPLAGPPPAAPAPVRPVSASRPSTAEPPVLPVEPVPVKK